MDPADMWGFCSSSCVEKEITPSSYHEEAEVDVLRKQNIQLVLHFYAATRQAYKP